MMNYPQWLNDAIKTPDEHSQHHATCRQQQLTKPYGALGDLENLAITLASLQGKKQPCINNPHITVFAADHGVAAENVSAFPQAVTGEMLRNFNNGGAAINVLSRQIYANLHVMDVGTINPPEDLQHVLSCRVQAGTENFLHAPAMSINAVGQALNIGHNAVLSYENIDLFIGGEMGIANTTSATAIACALLHIPAHILSGAGTGLDEQGIRHKALVIDKSLARYGNMSDKPLECLRHVGGLEIAALVGAYLTCAQKGIPVLVDGFICSVAALVCIHLQPKSSEWFLYSHQSAERGHQIVLDALNAKPLLNLNMRLGEASGAAVAVNLLRSACVLHNEMATFSEAGVSNKSE